MERLRKFFGLCSHKWEIFETHKGTWFKNKQQYEEDRGIPETHYVLRCEHCGDMKNHKTIGFSE